MLRSIINGYINLTIIKAQQVRKAKPRNHLFNRWDTCNISFSLYTFLFKGYIQASLLNKSPKEMFCEYY